MRDQNRESHDNKDQSKPMNGVENRRTAVPSDNTEVSDSRASDEETGDDENQHQGSGFTDLSEILRKAVITGLGAAMVGEESVRSAIRELTPGAKEAIGTAIDQAGRGREEIRRIVSDEAKRLMDSPALKREITRSLSSLAIEMTVRIRLNPDGTGPDITFSQPRLCREKKSEDSNSAEASPAVNSGNENAPKDSERADPK